MSEPADRPVVLLAGGVGGARIAHGLQAALGPDLVVVVNTGDDLEQHGLAVWPDHDTVLYTLAGLDDRARGWGLRDETWTAMEQLGRLGQPTWFRIGDRDLATHLVRTARLRAGARPTEVARELATALGIGPTILPMSDDPVRTEVRTDDGWLEFQDYFVRLAQAPTVLEVRFRGIESSRPTAEVVAAIERTRAIIVAPSNPIVSIGPILAVPGIGAAIERARGRGVPSVAISPIVGGRALKGPADRMLASLGEEPSALGVARRYADLVDAIVIDSVDAALGPSIAAIGIEPVVTDAVMTDDTSRERLARTTLSAAGWSPATDRVATPGALRR